MQTPCYRNGTPTKGYVQASMLDYYLGYGMEAPKMPDIEIIGGDREPGFSATPESSSSIASPESSSSDVPQITEAYTELAVQWNLHRTGGLLLFDAGSAAAQIRLFDMNGKLLHSASVAAGATHSLPRVTGATLLRVQQGSKESILQVKP
jgi:hypothetical protein